MAAVHGTEHILYNTTLTTVLHCIMLPYLPAVQLCCPTCRRICRGSVCCTRTTVASILLLRHAGLCTCIICQRQWRPQGSVGKFELRLPLFPSPIASKVTSEMRKTDNKILGTPCYMDSIMSPNSRVLISGLLCEYSGKEFAKFR